MMSPQLLSASCQVSIVGDGKGDKGGTHSCTMGDPMGDSNDAKHFDCGSHQIDIIVTGYPGKSVCHGSLGWSTIALIRYGDRRALVDVGSFSQRKLLLEYFTANAIAPTDITDVLLTHAHYDHSINWVMFEKARIVIGGHELDWSLDQPWGMTAVPELYVRELAGSDRLHRIAPGDAVFPGVRAHLGPGHTPGCLVYVLDAGERDVIFTGDACKNRAELVSRDTDMTYDAAVSRATIDLIWELWRQKPGSVLVPGHDLPMIIEGDQPQYLGTREAAVSAWFGDGMDQTTLISLTGSVAR